MEMRLLSITLLIFFITWINGDARKIVIFENTEVPTQGLFSIDFLEIQTNERKGPLLITREFFNEADGLLDRGEAQGVILGKEMPESVPRLARVKHELDRGVWKMLDIAQRLPGFPAKDAVVQSGEVPLLQGSSLDFICNACIEVSKQAEQVLSEPAILEQVQKLAKDVCKILPSNLSEQCEEMSQTYIQETIATLQDYLSQEKLCISTGLCHANDKADVEFKVSGRSKSSLLEANDGRTCEICEQFTEEAIYYMSQNKTQSEVLSVLHQSCSKLRNFGAECHSLVDYYAPLFFLEVTTINSKEFCQKINFCSSSGSFSVRFQPKNCALCESAILEIKTELQDPDTQMKVIQMMLDGCKRVPSYMKECKKLVFEYGPLILANIEQYLDANDVCTKIHVCESAAPHLESNIAVSEPLIQLSLSESPTHASWK
eukprot:Gb_31133 [translate_table: standard]